MASAERSRLPALCLALTIGVLWALPGCDVEVFGVSLAPDREAGSDGSLTEEAGEEDERAARDIER
jgi:hypothetical protein